MNEYRLLLSKKKKSIQNYALILDGPISGW